MRRAQRRCAFFIIVARAKTALFAERTQFVAPLRPQRVNVRDFINVCPFHRGQRAEPSLHGNSQAAPAENFVTFFAPAKITLFAERTQFVAPLRPRRVNVRDFINACPSHRGQRAEPSPHGNSQASPAENFVNLISARLKTALFNKRTQFVAPLRPRRVNVRDFINACPSLRGQRAEPSPHGNSQAAPAENFVNFFARAKITLFASAPNLSHPCDLGG